MTSETQEIKEPSKLRKLVVPMLLGGVVGFLAMMGLNHVLDSEWIGNLSRSAEIAAMVGTFYVIIALGVGAGVLSPALGSKFMNVEDAEELREQRPMLLYSAVAMVLFGVALVALALAGPAGILSNGQALWIASTTFIAGAAIAVFSYRHSDELMLAVNLEATAVTYALILFAMGGWAMCAHLGFARVPAPLDWITSFYTLMLVGTFVAAGRRGMLKVK